MVDIKITVLKKMVNKELIDEYQNLKIANWASHCEAFNVGNEFVVKGLEKPKGFCSWAWADLWPHLVTLTMDGNFYWMKQKGTAVVSCSDGMRPVIFKLERIQNESPQA